MYETYYNIKNQTKKNLEIHSIRKMEWISKFQNKIHNQEMEKSKGVFEL